MFVVERERERERESASPMNVKLFYLYSQTCLKQPPMGSLKCGASPMNVKLFYLYMYFVHFECLIHVSFT